MFEELFDQDYIQKNYMDLERERAEQRAKPTES